MAYIFGDGWDCYAAPADAIAGYWDSGAVQGSFVAGRFSSSQGWAVAGASATTAQFLKSSGANDALHHISVAFQQTVAVSGTTNIFWITLYDGATAQCSVQFRSDGAILLAQGASSGTALATYTGAVTASNTWYQFEIEVRVSNTAGFMNVRKLGNTSNDFTSATNLDTAGGTANDYANRLGIGTVSSSSVIDDLLWRSDSVANGVPWVADIRCSTRRPASDAAVQWTPSAAVLPFLPWAAATTQSLISGSARYLPFTAPVGGTVGAVLVSITTANTGNLKTAIYNAAAGVPTTVLATSNQVTAPGIGVATFTFSNPPTLVQGTAYFVALDCDASNGAFSTPNLTPANGLSGTTLYASFPAANPPPASLSTSQYVPAFTINITLSGVANAPFVADNQQDAANSYVYSSTVGQSDLYGISSIATTPASIVCVTTRGYLQKSDAGTRNTSVQLKSGSTTVSSTSAALNTVWGWQYRTDTVDPATGAAWTAVGVNNCSVGVIVTA